MRKYGNVYNINKRQTISSNTGVKLILNQYCWHCNNYNGDDVEIGEIVPVPEDVVNLMLIKHCQHYDVKVIDSMKKKIDMQKQFHWYRRHCYIEECRFDEILALFISFVQFRIKIIKITTMLFQYRVNFVNITIMAISTEILELEINVSRKNIWAFQCTIPMMTQIRRLGKRKR